IAAALRAAGFRRGERIGVLINNRVEWLETCFGAAALGITVVPFSTWSKPEELAYLLADSEIAALFAVDSFAGQNFAETLAALAPDAPRLRQIVLLGGELQAGWIDYDAFRAGHPPLAELPSGEAAAAADDALIL